MDSDDSSNGNFVIITEFYCFNNKIAVDIVADPVRGPNERL